MKTLLLILLLIPANLFAANIVVYDDAPQTVTNKIIEIRTGTVAELGAVTGMTDGFKYTVTDGSTITSCTSGGGTHKVECCYDESESEWEACHPGINPTAYPVILTTVPAFAGQGLKVGSDGKSIDTEPHQAVITILNPNSVESESLAQLFWFMNDITITYVWCAVDSGVFYINLIEGDQGFDMLTSDLPCVTVGWSSCASGCSVDTIDTDMDNIAGKEEWFGVSFTQTDSDTNSLTIGIGYTID